MGLPPAVAAVCAGDLAGASVLAGAGAGAGNAAGAVAFLAGVAGRREGCCEPPVIMRAAFSASVSCAAAAITRTAAAAPNFIRVSTLLAIARRRHDALDAHVDRQVAVLLVVMRNHSDQRPKPRPL